MDPSVTVMVAEWPDSWENMAKVNVVTNDRNTVQKVVLFTGYTQARMCLLSAEAQNCAVWDCACSVW